MKLEMKGTSRSSRRVKARALEREFYGSSCSQPSGQAMDMKRYGPQPADRQKVFSIGYACGTYNGNCLCVQHVESKVHRRFRTLQHVYSKLAGYMRQSISNVLVLDT